MQIYQLHHLPFDSHVHFRRNRMLQAVVPHTAKQCWGAVVMPNTATPHIETSEAARAYWAEILLAAPQGFHPVITCYLTPHTDPRDLERGFKDGYWGGAKVYPPGATTNSTEGVPGDQLPDHPALATMERIGMPLLLHPEVNKQHGDVVDIYDREKKFIDILRTIRRRYPKLRISVEHVTSGVMARYVEEIGDPNFLVCTITAHHLLRDRRDLHEDGWQPHLFCYPILKRKEDREALCELATAGYDFVSAGTDSAPHPTHAKEKACGCAGGVFTAHAMVEMYAQVFDEMRAMHRLEKFLCINGPRFYGLDPKKGIVVLKKEAWKQDVMIDVGDGTKVRPFGYHENPEQRVAFPWKVTEILPT